MLRICTDENSRFVGVLKGMIILALRESSGRIRLVETLRHGSRVDTARRSVTLHQLRSPETPLDNAAPAASIAAVRTFAWPRAVGSES